MTQRRTLSNNKIALLGCLLFLLNVTVRAAEFVQSVSREGSQIGLTQPYNTGSPQSWDYNPFVVYDQFFQTPTPNNALRDIYITGILKLNDRNRVNYPKNWRLDVTYTIKLYNANNTLSQTLTGEKLSINYYKNANYEDQAQKIYRSGTANHRAVVEITEIKTVMLNDDGSVNAETTPNSLGALFRDVSLEWQCTSVRSLKFNANTAPVAEHLSGNTLNQQQVCESNTPDNIIRLAWNFIPGAESYDVEWLFLDIPPTAVTASGITPPAYNTSFPFDWRNATRVNVTGNVYDIPLLYPTGAIVYRVRGVGVDIDNNFLRTEGKWSRVPTAHAYKDNLNSVPNRFIFCGLEYKQNWTATLSFAEEGKRKGVVSFVDGTGKTRQTVTTLSTDQNTIVAEPSLDNVGRPSVNFLPVAVRGEHFTYFENFNGGFDATVYDSPASYPTTGPVAGIPPAANSAVDDFYSSANPIVNLTGITSPTPYDEYLAQLTGTLPDAKHYPFVQTRMLNDGSGRPYATSGVGDQHMLGAHDTRYVYGSPGTQAEVDRLFGSEAGFVSYYKKNMVIDPNGQVSVAYLDGYGRTVATALAGANTADRLVSVAQPPVPITGTLLDNNATLPNGTLVATKDITVAVPNTVYTFSYAISQAEYETACLGNYGCKFEFLITVKDHEGNSVTPTTAPAGYGPATWCDADLAPSPYVLAYTLPVGKYTITKTLRIKQAAYQTILASVNTAIGTDYQNADDCFVPPFEGGCVDCATQCVNGYKYTYTHAGQTYWIYRNLGSAGPDYTNEPSLLAVTDVLGNPIFQTPGNMATIMADAEAAITACRNLCTQTPTLNTGTECEMKRILLLRDLLPGGQYFDNRPKDPEYTGIANADYLTGSETDADNRNAWLSAYAGGLLDDFNALLNPAAPSNTSWEYVRAHWSEINEAGTGFAALKEQLIQLHPEYCIWKSFCEKDDDTCRCKNGQPAPYGSPQDYYDRINAVHTDQEAIDQYLFIPQGIQPMYWNGSANQLASQYLPAGGVDWDNNCYMDPLLLNCENSNTFYNLRIDYLMQNYMQVPVTGGTRTISVWYIITDPENLRLYNLASGPHPVYPESFVQYMQTLHGSPATPQGLLAPLNTTPQSGQISRWQFFRSLYSSFRAQYQNDKAMAKVGACLPQNHPLTETANLCAQGFGAEAGYACNRLPYLSVWDNDDDGYLDMGGTGAFSFNGIQLRYPYIALLDGFGNSTAQLQASYCESNCSALATQWLNQMQNGICACVNPGTEGGNPVTPAFVFDDAQKELLRDYFIKICGKSCEAQNTAGVYTNDFTQFTGMTASDWTGFGMGAYYPASSSNVIRNVQQVVDRFMEYNGNAEGCPVLINPIPTGGQPAASPDGLACVCNNISEFIYENNGLKSGYGLVNPLKWQTVASNANTVFDFSNIGTALGELGYATNGHTQQLVLHWLDQCNVNASATINDIGISSTNYTLPTDFLCQQPANGFDDLGELDCAETEQEQAVTVNSLAFNLFREAQLDSFQTRYPANCLQQARSLETFTITYSLDEYHYTLYYYDQAGNLVKTVPPEGVKVITDQQRLADIAAHRLAHHHEEDYADQTGFVRPGHFNVTNYVYNGQNHVTKQTTPDGGTTLFYYDGLGRLVLSQNAKQAATPKKYSYTLFDAIGRITEVGEMPLEVGSDRVTIQRFAESFAASGQTQTPLGLLVYNNRALKTQVTLTHYDIPAADRLGIATVPFVQQNLRNRVSATGYLAAYPSNEDTRWYDNATFYTYDIHGNVNSVAQDIPALQAAKRRFLVTDYRYDLVSGKVNEIHYMKGHAEQFSHYYGYDADNRITGVYTSKNGGIIKELEAKYFYYPTGPLARVELGRAQVQGIDYAYTIHGWLKGVNADEMSTRADMGSDAQNDNANLHALFGMDAAGFTLGYYGGDYTAIGGNGPFEAGMSTTAAITGVMHPNTAQLPDWGLYNGNISKMVSAGLDCAEAPMEVLARGFKYDQLNRISASTSFVRPNVTDFQAALTSAFTWNGIAASSKWATAYTYNADGDIKTLRRAGDNGPMDNLTYNYKNLGLNSHQLDYIDDSESAANYPMDIEDQGSANYTYDPIGNLETDITERIQRITWNVYGKVKSVARFADSDKMDQWFGYNPGGQRIVKINRAVNPAAPEQGHHTTFYALDAQGNILAIYENRADKEDSTAYEFVCTDQMIYGSARIGMVHRNIKICENCVSMPGIENSVNLTIDNTAYVQPQPITLPTYQKASLGTREYELSNHLGNVLATLMDRKVNQETDVIGTGDNAVVFQYRPEVVSSGEYYPFGMKLPGRGCTTPVLCTNTTTVTEEWMYLTEVFTHLTSIAGSGTVITPQTCNGNPCAQVETLGDQNGAEFGFSLRPGYHELVFDVETLSKTGDAEVRMVVLGYNTVTGKFSDELAEYVNPPAGEQTLSIVGTATRDYKIRLEQRRTGTTLNSWRNFKVRITRETTVTDCQPGISTVTAKLVDEKFEGPCNGVLLENFEGACTNVMDVNFDGACTETVNDDYDAACTNVLTEDFGSTCTTTFTEDFTDDCSPVFTEDFTATCSTYIATQDFASGYDNTLFFPNTSTLTATGGVLSFTGSGLKVSFASLPAGTYTATFNYASTGSNISTTTVGVSGGSALSVNSGDLVEYTFATTGGNVDLLITLNGSGTKTANIDNFSLCANTHTRLGQFKTYGTVSALKYSGNSLSVSTSASSGSGMVIELPTTPGKMYSVRFSFNKVTPATVTNLNISTAGAPSALNVYGNGGEVEYRFTAPTGTATTTQFAILLTGTGNKTVTIDDLTLCEHEKSYAGFLDYGSGDRIAVNGKLDIAAYQGGSGVNIKLPTSAGNTYTVKFDYVRGNNTSYAQVYAVGIPGAPILNIADSATTVYYTFTMPAGSTVSYTYLHIGLWVSGGDKLASIDNLSLCQSSKNFDNYGGFEGATISKQTFNNGKFTFGTPVSGHGLQMIVPTTPGKTYTARFKYKKLTPATIYNATLSCSAPGNNTFDVYLDSTYMSYTFTVPASATTTKTYLYLQLSGLGPYGGQKIAEIDDLTLCEQADDYSMYRPYGSLAELSFDNKTRFTTYTSGHGLKVTVPTSAGKTYTARFNLDKVTTPITNMYVSASVGSTGTLVYSDNANTVTYTFSVPAGTTATTADLYVLLEGGNGAKTATLDNFTLCEAPQDYLATFKPYINTPTMTFDGKLAFTTNTASGNGVKIVMPTVIGSTYRVAFDYTKVSSAITGATVQVTGNPVLNVAASGAVEYTFTATAATTELLLQINGSGYKTAYVDNFTLCRYDGSNYGIFAPSAAGTLAGPPTFAGGKATFTTAGATTAQGININLPTVAGKTYRFSFDYTKTSSLITATTLQKTGSPAVSVTAGTGATVPVEYTFTATGTTTTLALLVTGGSGAKTFSVDNVALCEYPESYNIYTAVGTLATPISFTGGQLTVNTTANSGTGLNVALATTIGETYTVTFDFTKEANVTSASLQATGGASQSITASGPVTYTFTASTTSTNLSLLVNGTGTGVKTVIIDNLVITYETEMATAFDGYRYGFNGKEKVNETYGNANAYDFGARIYDPRIGRWLATDPLQADYAFASPYNFCLNSPITCIDPDGQKIIITRKPKEGKDGRDLVITKVEAKWVDKTGRYAALQALRLKVSSITDKDSKAYERQSKKLTQVQEDYDAYSKKEMDELKTSIESTFTSMDATTEWKAEVTISDGSGGNIQASDHVIYAVPFLDELTTARVNQIGGMVMYYSPTYSDGYGRAKIRAHEIAHWLGLLHNLDNLFAGRKVSTYSNEFSTNEDLFQAFGISSQNLMDISTTNRTGTDLTPEQFGHIEKMYNEGRLNQGENTYDENHRGYFNPDGYEIDYQRKN